MSALVLAFLLFSNFVSAQSGPQLTESFLSESTAAQRLEFYEQMVESYLDFCRKGHLGQHFEAPFYKPIVKELLKQQSSWLQAIRDQRALMAKQPTRIGYARSVRLSKEFEETFIRLRIIGRDLLAMNLPYQSVLRYARLHAMAVSGYEIDKIFSEIALGWNVNGSRQIATLIAESPKLFLVPLPFALTAHQLNHWQDVPVFFLDVVPSRATPTFDSSSVPRFARSGVSAHSQWSGAGLTSGDPARRLTGMETQEERLHLLAERSREWNELLEAIEKKGTPSEVELSHFLLYEWHHLKHLGADLSIERLLETDKPKMIRFLMTDSFQSLRTLRSARARLHQAAQRVVSQNFNSICISLFKDLDKQI